MNKRKIVKMVQPEKITNQRNENRIPRKIKKKIKQKQQTIIRLFLFVDEK